MASLIASGTTEATSADFTVAAGTPASIFLHSASGVLQGDHRAVLKIKSNAGVYRVVQGGELHAHRGELVITGPGTYQVVKFGSTVAFGVDKE